MDTVEGGYYFVRGRVVSFMDDISYLFWYGSGVGLIGGSYYIKNVTGVARVVFCSGMSASGGTFFSYVGCVG